MKIRRWQLSEENVQAVAAEVAGLLNGGGVVALPTETFYGLAACCDSPAALSRVSRLKRRPANMPLLALVDGVERTRQLAGDIPGLAVELIRRFWPGPLTLVLPCSRSLPVELLGAGGTVAVRHSSHPFPTAVVKALGRPITGTSANLSGTPPPQYADDITLAADEILDGVVDGGRTAGELPSTLLRIEGNGARILRAGALTEQDLREALGTRLL